MIENIGLSIAGLALLVLVVAGYVTWRGRRRDEDAESFAVAGDQNKSGGGGGPKPVK